MCDRTSAEEVAPCDQTTDKLVCHWSDWSNSQCMQGACGATSVMKSRVLGVGIYKHVSKVSDVLFASDAKNTTCSGTQTRLDSCDQAPCHEPCKPRHCAWS